MMTTRSASPKRALLLATTLALLLQACVSAAPRPARAPRPVSQPPPTAPRQPVIRQPREARLDMAPGLEGVIGASADQLTRQFGEARLDVWEGDVRKLQFSGTACILDIYLYPTSQSREPIATYVDARRGSDAVAVDRAACVKALKAGREPGFKLIAR